MQAKWLLLYKHTAMCTPGKASEYDAPPVITEYNSYDEAWYAAEKLIEKGSYQKLTIVRKEADIVMEIIKKPKTTRYS